jgi:hypothetical protein
MDASQRPGAASPGQRECSGLVTAYREGLALAAIVVFDRSAGICIAPAADNDSNSPSTIEQAAARWWCRSAAEAARIAAAAMARMNRRESRGSAPTRPVRSTAAAAPVAAVSLAVASVMATAKRLGVPLQTDDELADEAMNAAARVDAELEKLRNSGGLKSINKAYRSYRLETGARGERALRYDAWMRKYRENLVRQVAATLRVA